MTEKEMMLMILKRLGYKVEVFGDDYLEFITANGDTMGIDFGEDDRIKDFY